MNALDRLPSYIIFVKPNTLKPIANSAGLQI